MVKKPFIYIAGPITKGDHPVNIRNGIDAFDHIARLGGIPFCPMFDFLYRMVYPDGMSYDALLDYDKQIILRCDAVMRLPGESKGADIEEKFAKENHIPFFVDWEALAMWIINYGQEKSNRKECCGYSD